MSGADEAIFGQSRTEADTTIVAVLNTVALAGGPVLYREAVAARLHQSGAVVIDTVASPEADTAPAEVTLWYCDEGSDWDWDIGSHPTVVVLPRLDVELYIRALRRGAGAVHVDTSSEIIVAVAEAAAMGEVLLPMGVAQALTSPKPDGTVDSTLTRVERRIARLLLEDASTARIANELSYSDRTIRRRLQTLYIKLGAKDRETAIAAIEDLDHQGPMNLRR